MKKYFILLQFEQQTQSLSYAREEAEDANQKLSEVSVCWLVRWLLILDAGKLD